jgi:recombination protein RecT
MWLKTAARRLAKWVPTSAEYMREQLRAVRDVAAEQPAVAGPPPQPLTPDTDDGEVVEGELVDHLPDPADSADPWAGGDRP